MLKEAEKTLAAAIGAAQKRVHAALLDNLNTRGALDVLGELIRDVNKYLAEHQAGQGEAQSGEAALCCCRTAQQQGRVQTVLHCVGATVGVTFQPVHMAAQQHRDTARKQRDTESAMVRHSRLQGTEDKQTPICSYGTACSPVWPSTAPLHRGLGLLAAGWRGPVSAAAVRLESPGLQAISSTVLCPARPCLPCTAAQCTSPLLPP